MVTLSEPGYGLLVGRSQAMLSVYERLERLRGGYNGSVLITGRTGTGKELVADEIQRGSRRELPYTKVNCAALPESLAEAEFFGYKQGAFTGANQDTRGIFLDSDGRTVLLDEVAELPLAVQGKLLRVLENGEIRAVGSSYPEKVDVRILSSTNKDLRELTEEGRFRQDLFYRLNSFEIHLPDLAERLDDIELLAYHFLDEFNRRYGKDKELTPDAIWELRRYDWPGNVRELKYSLERAYLFSSGTEISSMHIAQANIGTPNNRFLSRDVVGGEILSLKELESSHIKKVLDDILLRRGGTLIDVALSLGISIKGLRNKLKRYGLYDIYVDRFRRRRRVATE